MSPPSPRLADVVAATLSAYGITHFFQVTGGDPALWTALQAAGIRMVACRSEAGAVYMADGYARASGKPGVVYAQHGPGAANLAAALADAHWAMSPVVSLTSSMPATSRYRHEYQDLDQLKMMEPVTRWTGSITDPGDASRLIAAALDISLLAPGPTHIEIPRDLFGTEVAALGVMEAPQATTVPGLRSRPSAKDVVVAAEAIVNSRRPLLLAGGGILLSGAEFELARLAAHMGIPVATSLAGKGGYDETGDLAVGVIGRYAGRAANEIAARADLVVVIGCNLDGLVTDSWKLFSQGTRYVQIDTDIRAFQPGPNVHRLLGDARLALEDLSAALEGFAWPARWEKWSGVSRDSLAAWKGQRRRLAEAATVPLHPATVMSILQADMAERSVLVADTGYMAAWTATMFDVPGHDRPYFRAAGSLGWGLPGAIGVALACEGRRVVCITGDGGAGYHIMELETAVRNHVPVLICVLNNGTLAFEYHIQRYIEHNVIGLINDFEIGDYAAVASALGAAAMRVSTADELRSALAATHHLDGPMLVDILIDPEAIPPVTTYDGVMDREL